MFARAGESDRAIKVKMVRHPTFLPFIAVLTFMILAETPLRGKTKNGQDKQTVMRCTCIITFLSCFVSCFLTIYLVSVQYAVFCIYLVQSHI